MDHMHGRAYTGNEKNYKILALSSFTAVSSCCSLSDSTVEPRSAHTLILRIVSFVPAKSYIFSKINPLIMDSVNMPLDNGHHSMSRLTNSYTSPTPLYGHSVHCPLSLSCTIISYLSESTREGGGCEQCLNAVKMCA